MYAQCDEYGNEYALLDFLVDLKNDENVLSLENQNIVKIVVKGRVYLHRSTVGWKNFYQWKDGSTSWEKLSYIEEYHPVQTAEYDVAQGISCDQAFNWWVRHVFSKKDQIIALFNRRNARYLKRTHKWGFRTPKDGGRIVWC